VRAFRILGLPMALDDAVAESNLDEQQLDLASSGDVRGAIQSAMKEISDRARDEQGRFAASLPPAPAPAPTAAAPAPAEAAGALVAAPAPKPDDAQAAGQAAAPAPAAAIKPPDSWSPAAKAKFSTLDPEIQAEVMRRETEVHKGFTRQDEHRNLGKNFSEAVTPYLPMIRSEGGDPVAAVQTLLQTAYMLRTAPPDQKQNLLIQIAQTYGVDMQGVFTRLSGGQPRVDPQVAQLQQQLWQLQQERQQSSQTTEAQQQAQINAEIDAFAADSQNLYFANVKPEMAALMREGRAQSLKEAYDMACWARPDIRTLMLQQQEQQKVQAARDKAQRARSAGVSISGSPTGSTGAGMSGERSLRDELRANLREVADRS